MKDEIRYIIRHGLDKIYRRVFEEYPNLEPEDFRTIFKEEIKYFL